MQKIILTKLLKLKQTQFYAKVTFNNLDIDETIAAKLTISGESKVHEETISVYNLYTEENKDDKSPNQKSRFNKIIVSLLSDLKKISSKFFQWLDT